MQQRWLADMLRSFNKVFDGKLGKYPHGEYHLETVKDAKPAYWKVFPVLFQQEKRFLEELEALVRDGVLKKGHGGSEWTSPTFIVPKKDGWVQRVLNFWELNKVLKQKPNP